MKYFQRVNKDRYALNKTEPSILLEYSATIALDLILHWGTVAGKVRPEEDSSGRSVTTLQEPKELVERCFTIAEEFIKTCEEKELIQEIPLQETDKVTA